ncbi:MAG: OmpH family outer membrane protein [Alistipes sp.]
MKLTLVVVLMMGATSLFAQKFGRIDMQALIVAMPETTELQTNMEAYGKDLQNNMETMQVEFNTKYQEFQKSANTMAEGVRQIKEKELTDLQQRQRDFSTVAQEEYQKKQNELLAPIVTKAKDAVTKVSKAGGYSAVFDTAIGALAYVDEATITDLMPAVKLELGIKNAPATPAVATPAAKK